MGMSSRRVRKPFLRVGAGLLAASLGSVGLFVAFSASPQAQQARQPPPLPQGYIGGVVESPSGPEAGVWVIAETTDLPTKFVKIVVTNDAGRYMLPELPTANYNVWVRGYGLVDSTPVKAKPDLASLPLKVSLARTPQEAAKVYPGNYWYSLIEPPKKSEFPGTGPGGNGISPQMLTQAHWIDNMKQGCELCHQLGTQLTRGLGHMSQLGFKSSIEAWDHRVQTGVRGGEMTNRMDAFGRQRGLKMFADWTDRIAAGEVPPAPPRPTGVERNLVLTLWDWGVDTSFIHDEATTSKSKPTVNPYGEVYGVSAGHGMLTVTNPIENNSYELKIPTIDDPNTIPSRFPPPAKPSNFHGMTPLWSSDADNPADPHNPMLDDKGRVWMTSTVRGRSSAAWCKAGSSNKFAQYFPIDSSNRQASYFDPRTQKFTLIDTCFGTHHLQFSDSHDTLYFSGGGQVLPWIDVKKFDATGDGQASQGWCPTVLDTNADGKITKPWNEPVGGGRTQEQGGGGGQLGKFDPTLDTRINVGSYGIIVAPDNALWSASTAFPGRILRFTQGANPPESCMTEMYQVPTPEAGYGTRGIDVDRNGVIWTALSGSSHLASFDRRKCKVFNGPAAVEGKQCAEGWTLYQTDGPNLKGTDVKADFHYYNWVDQYNTLGLGENLPIATGTGSDSMLVLKPETREWIKLRVPYPLGFFSRGVDGRIDNPSAGWKGRGLWANYGSNYLWHTEGGKGTKSKIVHFQMRPDPLAR